MNRKDRPPSVDALARRLGDGPARLRVMASRSAVKKSRSGGDALVAAHEELARLSSTFPGPVINMSGTVLHTGLGRAVLARQAVEAMVQASIGHAAVELDLGTGARGDRQDRLREYLIELTGAEDALVVNNCAGAVVLSLAAHCHGKCVLLSRGEMVEIGGSFRLPEIVSASGAVLQEVGCTNKTRLSDYESAWDENTAGILRCHPSNFQIVGFTEAASPADLAELCRKKGGILIDDVGSGCLIDTTHYGLPAERTLGEALRAGPHLVLASGDKLLGGPQAGLVLGTAEAVKAVAKHPLARAFRVDKVTLAALAATLRLYLEGKVDEIPVWASLRRPLARVRRDAHLLAQASCEPAEAVRATTVIGGGSLPGSGVPTWACRVDTKQPDALAQRLRVADPPAIGYVANGCFWLDPRTASPPEVRHVCRLLAE
ncbi:MAG: L-seryl-tRNA(Sec) selenium transferase [Fimbriimonadaceae bacterium]